MTKASQWIAPTPSCVIWSAAYDKPTWPSQDTADLMAALHSIVDRARKLLENNGETR